MKTLAWFVLAIAQETTEEKQIESRISTLKMSVDFRGIPLEEALDYVREVAGINLVLDASAQDAAARPVTLKVEQLAVRSVLKLLLDSIGLRYDFEEGVLLVTSRAAQKLILELYDVRDLLHAVRDYPGLDISLDADSLGATFTGGDDGGEESPFRLEELVRAHAGGTSWDDQPEARVSLHNGILLVKNTKDVHRQVRRLLDVLRGAR